VPSNSHEWIVWGFNYEYSSRGSLGLTGGLPNETYSKRYVEAGTEGQGGTGSIASTSGGGGGGAAAGGG